MQEDKLTDFERAEYYKARLKAKAGFIVVLCIFMFLLGFAVSRTYYTYMGKTNN